MSRRGLSGADGVLLGGVVGVAVVLGSVRVARRWARAWGSSASVRSPLLWFCLASIWLAAGAVAVGVWWAKRRWRPPRLERHGRWAMAADVRRLRVRRPGPGRLVLGRGPGGLVASEEGTNVCVVGPTQTGKTSGLLSPWMLEAGPGDGPIVAVSVKSDLHDVTVGRRRELGEVRVFDPGLVAVGRSASWSPLRAAGSVRGAQSAAKAIVGSGAEPGLSDGRFWTSAAYRLIWATLFVAARCGRGMADVVRWLTAMDHPRLGADGLPVDGQEGELCRLLDGLAGVRRVSAEEGRRVARAPQRIVPKRTRPDGVRRVDAQLMLLDPGASDAAVEARAGEVLAELDDDPAGVVPANVPTTDDGEVLRAWDALWGVWRNRDERTLSNFYATAETFVAPWSDPGVAAASGPSAACEVSPEWLLSGDNTLFVVAPSKDQEDASAVFATLVADVVNGALETAVRSGGRLDRRLLVLLDEAANVAPVGQLPEWSSTVASHNVCLVSVWQDRAQMVRRYGRGAETIWSNSRAKVVLGQVADEAMAGVARLLGEEEHDRPGESVDLAGGSRRRSRSVSTGERQLVTADGLRRQPDGSAVLIYGALPPVRLRLRPWFADKRLRALQAGGLADPVFCLVAPVAE